MRWNVAGDAVDSGGFDRFGGIAGRLVVSRRASFMVKIHSYRDRHNFTFRLMA
jgi:hypothetical protein